MSVRLMVLCLSVVSGLAFVACGKGASSLVTLISSWGPQSGPAGTTVVTVFGSGLQGKEASVKVGGVTATDVNGDDQSIQFTVPVGAKTGPLIVNGVTAGTFTVT